jgi:hypothetical protein
VQKDHGGLGVPWPLIAHCQPDTVANNDDPFVPERHGRNPGAGSRAWCSHDEMVVDPVVAP